MSNAKRISCHQNYHVAVTFKLCVAVYVVQNIASRRQRSLETLFQNPSKSESLECDMTTFVITIKLQYDTPFLSVVH